MKVYLVKPYGFCSGVKRALRILKLAKAKYKRVYTWGEIIHNRPVVEKLREEGIIPIKRLRRNLNGVLVIRTHGVSPKDLKRMEKYDIKVIDTTCPYVKKVQEIVKMLAKEKYKVGVIGDRNHPEVVAIMGILGENGFLFPTGGEFKKDLTFFGKDVKIGIVCQTTVDKETMKKVLGEIVKSNFLEMRVFNTICREVFFRQNRFRQLMRKADAGLVAGGRESANTRRLYEIGSLSGRPTLWIEREKDWEEIKGRLGRLRVRSVCFVSGASTPDEFCLWVIKNLKMEG